MPSLNVDPQTKQRSDELQPNNLTQDEWVNELLDAYEHGDDPVVIDTEEIVEKAAVEVASKCELAAYRGCKEALLEYQDNDD